MGVILFIALLFGASFLYYVVKEKAKRNLFFKKQYEEQRALTHTNTVFIVAADIDSVRDSVGRHIVVDDSIRAAFLGGALKIINQSPEKITYRHSSSITAGGSSDEFTASISLESLAAHETRATVSIDQWREKDGVTRRNGIKAMRMFVDTAEIAFRAVDPRATLEAA